MQKFIIAGALVVGVVACTSQAMLKKDGRNRLNEMTTLDKILKMNLDDVNFPDAQDPLKILCKKGNGESFHEFTISAYIKMSESFFRVYVSDYQYVSCLSQDCLEGTGYTEQGIVNVLYGAIQTFAKLGLKEGTIRYDKKTFTHGFSELEIVTDVDIENELSKIYKNAEAEKDQ